MQNSRTCSLLCETSRIVTPLSCNPRMASLQRRWKAASPTERTSSITRISGSMLIAVAKPRRMNIPEE